MKNFDVIIIGGGLGGLTAGATLSRLGRKVLLLEQHYIPGGCATAFKRKTYIMEVGLHEMDGLHSMDTKQKIFDFLEVWKGVKFLKIPEFFRIKGKDFETTVPHGRESFIKTLGEQFPEDRKGIVKLVELMEGVLSEIPKLPSGWLSKFLLPIYPFLYPNIYEASRYTVGKWLDKYIINEKLKLILQGNIGYYADDPYQLSLVYFSAAQASYIGGGGHYIQGSSQQLSNYLATEICRCGGQVLFGKQVTDILVNHKNVVGVEFKDAFNEAMTPTKVYSSMTIANAALPLVKSMLPQTLALQLGKRIDHLKISCSLISIYIGFKKNLRELGFRHYSTFWMDDHINSLQDVGEANKSDNWHQKPFVFVDYSQIDAKLCPKDASVGVICAVDYLSNWENLSPQEYQRKKEEVGEIFINRLHEYLPGLREHIDYYEVGTPKTIQRYTLNPEGAPYGFAQTLSQSGRFRIPIKSEIKNLYFASAWSYPGGGFTGAIISGFLCGREVNKDLKHKTDAIPPIDDERTVALVGRKIIAENTLELSLEKPPQFNYKAGQYAWVQVPLSSDISFDLPVRALSMVSHPNEPHLKFAMRLSSSGFKQYCARLQKGDLLTIYGPVGTFKVAANNRPKVFLVAGIGITPIVPLLQELSKTVLENEIHLFYCNYTPERAAYHTTIQQWDIPNFHYHPVFTSRDGRLNRKSLHGLGRSLHQYEYYVVGTRNFVRSMESLLMDEKVSKAQINIDDFG